MADEDKAAGEDDYLAGVAGPWPDEAAAELKRLRDNGELPKRTISPDWEALRREIVETLNNNSCTHTTSNDYLAGLLCAECDADALLSGPVGKMLEAADTDYAQMRDEAFRQKNRAIAAEAENERLRAALNEKVSLTALFAYEAGMDEGRASRHRDHPHVACHCSLCAMRWERDVLAARVAAVEALADEWAAVPPHLATDYDRGRVEQRQMCETELRAVLDTPEGER